MDIYIAALVQYGLMKGLIDPADKRYITNQILMTMELDSYEAPEFIPELPLEEILTALTDHAVKRGLCRDDITSRDLFGTKLMGILTPRPSAVWDTFSFLYDQSPETATIPSPWRKHQLRPSCTLLALKTFQRASSAGP